MATTGRTYELKAVFSARNNASRTFTAMEKRIDKLQKKMESLDKKSATLKLSVTGDKKVEEAMDRIESKLDRFKARHNIHISLSGDRPVATKAEKLEQKIKEATENREVKFGAKTAELDNSVKRLRAQLTRFENDDINVNFNANDKAMIARAKTSKRTLDNMFARAVTAELDLNGDAQTIARAQAAQSAISKVARRYQLQIDYANAAQTDAKIRKTNAEADRLKAVREMRISAKGDDIVRGKIKDIQGAATHLSGRPYEVDLLGDSSQALRVLRSTESEMRRYSTAAYQATIKAEQRGMPEVSSQARALQQQLDKMQGKVTKVRTELEGVPPVLAGLAVVKRSAEGVEGDYEVRIQYGSLLSAGGAARALGGAVSGLGATLRQTTPLSEAFARQVYLGQQVMQGFSAALIAVGIAAIGPLVAGFTTLIASLGAAATGFGLLALAALPIIKAFSEQAQRAQEVETAQKALATSGEQVASAQKGLASAQRGVADAAKAGAEGIRSAMQAQKDAVEAVGDAQRALGQANAGVADARRAKEESVRQAVLAVADAYRGVQDAQRGVSDAQQGVVDARKAGEESIRSAIDAQADAYRGVQDAQRSLSDAHRGVVDARKAGEDSIRSAIQAQADAYRGLQDAQRSLSDAHRGVSDARKAREEGITNALQQQKDAQRAVQDAVVSLGDAHQDQRDLVRATADATEDFNRALKDEKYNIQDLKYEMQGFGLDQRELTLDIAEARRELADAENSEDRARAQIQLERLLLREKQLTNDQREAQQRLNDAQREGTENLQSARAARTSAMQAEQDGLRNIENQERALSDARRAALEAERGVTEARLNGDRQVADALRGVKDAQQGVSDAIRAIGEAERNVAKARTDAARQVADAQRGVLDAQRGLKDAINAVGDADRNVAKARADAARQVADAQKGVLEAQRGLKDAIRAVGEAERNVTKARVDGNKQIKDAQMAVLEAQRSLKDAINAVGEADRNVSKARQDAARQMADAQRAVRDAQMALTKALKEQQTAQQKLNSLMAKQPAYIQRIMDKVGQLKSAYKTAFADANVAVGGLIERVLDLAIRAMPKMGETAFRTAKRVDTAFDNIGTNWKVYGGIKSMIRIMNFVPRITQQWTEAFGNFGGAFTNIMGIAMPYALRFSQALNRAGEAFFRWSDSEQGRQRINQFFKSAAPVAKALGRVIWDIGGAILNWSIDHPRVISRAIYAMGEIVKDAGRAVVWLVKAILWFRDTFPLLWQVVKILGLMYIGFRVLRGPLLMLQKLWSVMKFLGIVSAAKKLGMLGDTAKTAGGKAKGASGSFSRFGRTAKTAAKGGAPGLVLAGRQAATANARAGKGAKGFTNLGKSVVTGGKNAKGGIVPITNVGNKSQLAGQKAMKGGGQFKTFGSRIATGGKSASGAIVPISKAGGAAKGAGANAAKSAGKMALLRGGLRTAGLAALRFVGFGNPVVGAVLAIGFAFQQAYTKSKTFRGAMKGLGRSMIDNKGISGLYSQSLQGLRDRYNKAGGAGGLFNKLLKNTKRNLTDNKGASALLNKALKPMGTSLGDIGKKFRGMDHNQKTATKSNRDLGVKLRNLNRDLEKQGGGIANIRRQWNKPPVWKRNDWGGQLIVFWRDVKKAARETTGAIGRFFKNVGKAIVSPFKWAYNRLVGNSIIPDLKNDMLKVFRSIPGGIRRALGNLGNTIAAPFRKGEKDGTGAMSRLAKGARNWTGRARDWITGNTNQAKNSSNKNHNNMQKSASEKLKAQASVTQREMNFARKKIHENTLSGNKSAVKHYTQMYEGSRNKMVSLKESVAKQTNEAKEKSNKNTNDMQKQGVKNARQQNDDSNNWFKKLRDNIGEKTNEGKDRSNKNTNDMQKQGVKNAGQQNKDTNNWFQKLRDNVGDKTNEAENRSTKNTQRMQENGAQNSRDLRNIVDPVFKEIRDFMTNPIESARDSLKGIWNGILTGIAKVLGAVGMDKAQKKVTGAKWAKGGIASDPSSVQTFAKGGLGTGRKDPRVHVWNEQNGNEAYIAERGNREDSLNYLKTAAGWHDADVVPRNNPLDPRSSVATPYRGRNADTMNAQHQLMSMTGREPSTGEPYNPRPIKRRIADRATNFSATHNNVYDYIKPRVETLMRPGVSWNTYQGHITSPGANEWSSVDYWKGPGQGDIPNDVGQSIANDAISKTRKGLLGVAAQGRMWYGGTWRPYPQRPHMDHTHVGWSADKNAGIINGGGGGGIMDSIWNRLAEPIWNRLVEKPLDTLYKGVEGGNVMNDIPVKAARTMVADPMKQMLMDKFNVSSGSGVTGDFSGSQKEMALTFAKNAVDRGIPGRLPVMTALQESTMQNLKGGHLDSAGYFQQRGNGAWGSYEQRTDPAHALDAFLDQAQKYKGNYPNSPTGLGAWAQRVQASAHPGLYSQHWDTAANLIGDPKYYAKGGMAKYTNGGMARQEQTAILGDNPRGEILWPLGDVRATRAISKAVQEGSRTKVSSGSTNTTATIGGRAQSQRVDSGSAQVVNAIDKMKEELRQTLKEELGEIEIGEQSLRTMYDAGFNQALKALASKKGRDIIDEQMGDDIDFHSLLGGKK